MVREIKKGIEIFSEKALPAERGDVKYAKDLLDTLKANSDICVGMAANMIGVSKRIIAFENGDEYMIMYNPAIVKKAQPYMTEEGCLSLEGRRQTKRYKSIKVQYQNDAFQTRLKTFTGWTAQIIQHEIDHCNGIII